MSRDEYEERDEDVDEDEDDDEDEDKGLLYTYWEILTKKLCRKFSYAN